MLKSLLSVVLGLVYCLHNGLPLDMVAIADFTRRARHALAQ